MQESQAPVVPPYKLNTKPGGTHRRGRAAGVDLAIGQRLMRQRVNAGKSQEWLGQQLDVSFQQIQKYEKGHNRLSLSTCLRIAEVLGISPTLLYDGLTVRTEGSELPAMSTDTLKFALMFENIPDTGTKAALRSLIAEMAGA